MTVLTSQSHKVVRETSVTIRDSGKLRNIIISLHPGYMVLRLKGRPKEYSLGYESAYRLALPVPELPKMKRSRTRRVL